MKSKVKSKGKATKKKEPRKKKKKKSRIKQLLKIYMTPDLKCKTSKRDRLYSP